ncbi:MAG: putative selenate ABC transporter substrate-binding protein [Deltaproteobacteria bacterium]|nr:MAG: putative selenate ABC transporter substrate-binding protein [Deltaproteobacteria bacterium]
MMRAMRLPLLLLALCAASCKSADPAQPLRVSMIPTTDPGRATREMQPLVDHLARRTGGEVQMTIPTNYAAVVEALVNDQVDIAHLGGFTYVQASKRAGAKPLVQRERDREFHSLFITQADSPIRSLSDLKGRSFAFGDVNSTSGHLMPEYFMRRNDVEREVIAKAIYTGGHDATLLAVANGKIDAGALDEAVFQRMTSQGKIDPAKVRVFWTTPPFFDYVWVARKGLDPRKADAVRDAFLALDPGDQQDRRILEALSASKYVPARDGDYGALREAALEAGLLK